jgi:hypothetical protein
LFNETSALDRRRIWNHDLIREGEKGCNIIPSLCIRVEYLQPLWLRGEHELGSDRRSDGSNNGI